MTEVVVLDASAWVDLLLQEPRGERVTRRLADAAIHAPAHIDLEMLSALGRFHRAGDLTAADVDRRLLVADLMPISRHPLPDLVGGAWGRRDSLRISDALYVELANRLDAPLITTDLRLARAAPLAEAIS